MRSKKEPRIVIPGQIWKDTDERSAGAGEFEIIEVGYFSISGTVLVKAVRVWRPASKRHSTIRLDRLWSGPYEYIGMKR